MEKIKNNFAFFVFGPVILGFDLLFDLLYFWKNNFRESEDLKQIIIIKEKSIVTNKSIRQILQMCVKYIQHKIKSCNSIHYVRNFSKKLNVIENIQFLMFGQMIPKDGFKEK